MLNVFLTNLTAYNNYKLVGGWVEVDTTTDWSAALAAIGANGENYFITDFDTDIQGLDIAENTRIEELKALAEALKNGGDDIAALIEAGETWQDAAKIVEAGSYILYSDVLDEYDLGYTYYEDGIINVPTHLEMYFDFEAFGRDIAINQCGTFTSYGYVAIS